jgi:acid phosphatase (class A)
MSIADPHAMILPTMRLLSAFASIVAFGCTTLDAPVPPTQMPEVRPGYVAGYLEAPRWPDSLALLPPPPAAGSAALAADEANYKATRLPRDSARWLLATRDAELRFPKATEHFACTLGIAISAEATPHLNMLLRRVRMDASRANDRAKSHYKRMRPFMVSKEEPCSKDEASPNGYPSGHASIGWAWALVLAEAAPDRADALYRRGLEFGMSRVYCGVHYASDVEAGRIVGAATVSRLHSDPVFRAQLALAGEEIARSRAAGSKPANDCEAEARALR